MSSVLDAKFADMQKTIKQQAQAQVDAIQTRMDEMMAQLKTANVNSTSTPWLVCVLDFSLLFHLPFPNRCLTRIQLSPRACHRLLLHCLLLWKHWTLVRTALTLWNQFVLLVASPIPALNPSEPTHLLRKKSPRHRVGHQPSKSTPRKTHRRRMLPTAKYVATIIEMSWQPSWRSVAKVVALFLSVPSFKISVIERSESGGFTELEDKPRKVIANPMISSLLTAIPMATSSPDSPRIVATKDFNTSYCTDEEEWA